MKKNKSTFVCQNCGFHSPKWMGKCPDCGEWSTLMEEIQETTAEDMSFPPSEPMLYRDIQYSQKQRLTVKIRELDRVLGGGIVLGSLVLIGGEPGIGKSTLLLQASRDFSEEGKKVLYVSSEESLEQMKMRGERLGIDQGELYLLAETNLEKIMDHAARLKPQVFILDSVQTVFSSKLSSGTGTISQVREVTNQVFRFAKKNDICSFLIGHITKEGSLAGPKSLEHMVDVVLYFEGERDHSHRILRAFKNRFGPVSEIAVFNMESTGLRAISNPSAFFLKERPEEEPGSVVTCTIKGSRPLLAEIQALVSSTLFAGNPRRMTIGLDRYRTAMLLAVIEKKLGFGFGGQDIHMNVAGGLFIKEPAADLGILAALVSCIKNKSVPSGFTMLGEIGLSGEVRSVNQTLARIKEARSLGFKSVVLPKGNLSELKKEKIKGIDLIGVKSIRQVVEVLF
ncbi:MAG: DNA repair protein RadA [Candidatus Aminicenantes bacterium]|nr:DNA repair protein RadA [Candidatus Aminicenantes bacterium]